MEGLLSLQRQLGPEYPFRIGLTFGTVYVDCIEGEGYREWTVVGESVNLAKRLHEVVKEVTSGIAAAFGVLASDTDAARRFQPTLDSMGPVYFGHWTHEVLPDQRFKGTSPAKVARLTPVAGH
jgi:class 3 adenylate cyclase